MADGFKSGTKDSGSVAALSGAGKVDRHEKTHNVEFAKGGNTKMFGEQQANPDKPGQTSKEDVNGKGSEFAAGGKGKMFGFKPSASAEAGKTSAY
jgi:hypothetical protein